MHIEQKRLLTHLAVSRGLGLQSDLSFDDWMETLRHFKNKCAYCKEKPYENIDHFIPHCKSGGTTVNNCIPSCSLCNHRKLGKHPDELGPEFDTISVADYLDSRKPTKLFLYIPSGYYSNWTTERELKYKNFVANNNVQEWYGRGYGYGNTFPLELR
jgi:Restriction endonuclease